MVSPVVVIEWDPENYIRNKKYTTGPYPITAGIPVVRPSSQSREWQGLVQMLDALVPSSFVVVLTRIE